MRNKKLEIDIVEKKKELSTVGNRIICELGFIGWMLMFITIEFAFLLLRK